MKRMGVSFCVVVFLLTFLVLIVLNASLVFAEDKEQMSGRTTVETNVLAPIVKVEVPDYVFFGNVSPGFSSERMRIDVDNVGTTAVSVTPRLSKADEPIFQNLFFARRTTEPYKPVGEFKLTIPKPSGLGKKESDYFYAKLDLSQYRDEVKNDMIGYRSSIVFWVLPQ